MPGVELVREQTRTRIAFIALYSYIGLIAATLIIGWWLLRLDVDKVLQILTATAGILSGIVGAIIGFYFRDKQD
jgi:membrane associated rhomboid family serine protease